VTSHEPQQPTSRVADVIALDEVMRSLASVRPLFHSEADLQFAFAQQLERLAPSLRCRLEVPRPREGRRSEYLDLVCWGPGVSTAIEFKYFTRPWTGEAKGEQYRLRAHAATDLARFYFVNDIVRLEREALIGGPNGLAIMLTNEPRLWAPPTKGRRTNDWAYRIHDASVLSGTLEWGNGYAANRRELAGAYEARWQDFSTVDDGPGGQFRWLAIPVKAPTSMQP